MGTNTSIYGEQTDWIATGSSGSGHADPNDNYYFANFGSGSSYNVSTLKAAVDNGKLTLNTPIDKSISWCGLGQESMFSKLESYNNKVWEDENDPFKMMNKDERIITNFGLFGKPGTWTLASPTVSNWYYADATAQTYASRARWAPEAGDGTSSTTSNFNMGLMPITQLPMRNCVAIPVIECRTAIDASPSNSGMTRAYAWEYFDPNSEINYTNHPYITAIGMQFWGTPSDLGGNRSNRLSGIHIAVLDETKACDGQPFDVEQPSIVQGATYQYYAMGRTYSTMSQRPGMGMTIMGLLSTNSDCMILPHASGYQRNSRGNIVIPHPNGQLSYVVNPSTAVGVGDWVYYYVQYYDGLQDWIREQMACFGLFFTDDEQTALNGELDSKNMFLGILEDGIGHGKYSRGEENRDQPQWNWATTNQSPYDPNNPPKIDPNEYDEENKSVLRNPLYAQIGGHTYITTGGNFQGVYNKVMQNLEDAIRQLQGAESGALYARQQADADPRDEDKALTAANREALADIYRQTANTYTDAYRGIHANPINSVKSILAFPFDLRPYISSSAESYMRWGLWNVSGKEEPASGDFNLVTGTTSQFWVPGGTCTYFAEYENFLDYSPYCSAELYIPYCGSVNIDPETFIGHDITVRYLVDWHTGACLALVYRDSLIVEQISGQMGISIPMIAADELSYANSMFQGQQAVKNAQTNAVATTVSGLANGFTQGVKMATIPLPTTIAGGLASITQSAAGIVTSYNNVKSAEYELATKQLSYKQLTTATPMTSTGNEQECRLVIYRPTFLDKNTKRDFGKYGHTTGFACLKNESLENYTGLTVCSSVDLSGIGQATEKEKEMIERALRSGVYL